MRYGSVCSGIAPQTDDWAAMGLECSWFAEIEAFPSAVLAYRHLEIPNLGDFTGIGREHGAIDLLVGGTPCQSFSVAGQRGGLDDPRGNLALEFLRLLDRLRPRWMVWENVPGVLSSDQGRDFGTFLGLLGQLGYGWAYRVLDAQYWGVAQRRRRVFVVGCLGDGRGAAAVLFDGESVSGHPAPCRETREGITWPVSPCIGASGRGFQRAGDSRGNDAVVATAFRFQRTDSFIEDEVVGSLAARDFKDGRDLITHSLSASHGSEDGTGRGTPIIAFSAKDHGADALEDCSPTLRSCGEYGVNGGPAPAVAIRTAHTGANGHGLAENVEHTLDQAQAQAVAFTPIADSLCASYGTKWIGNASADNGSQFAAVAIRTATIPMHDMVTRHAGTDGSGHQCGKGHGLGVGDPGDPGDPMFTLGAADKHSVAQGMAVRRLTPRECERLMGISDDYTLIPWRGKMASDGPRYKAIGNSWAVPVLNWIAKRLIGVDAVMTRRQMM